MSLALIIYLDQNGLEPRFSTSGTVDGPRSPSYYPADFTRRPKGWKLRFRISPQKEC